jgi:hypothetical protein
MHDTIDSAVNSSPIITHGIMAVFGAVANALRAHRNGESKGFWDFVMLTVMSSFSGVIFGLLAANTFDNQYMTLAAAGAGGLLGVDALTTLGYKIRDSLASTLIGKK